MTSKDEWRHTQPCVYDQRLALDWVKEILHHFGGDCNRVTVGGESPGPAITLHQITAFGGTQLAPFQQAYLSSPAFNPNPYDWLQEQTYNNFLGYANVSSLAELRAASSETIIRANELLVYNSTFGASGGIGPAVDGNIVPQLPALLLAQSRRAKNNATALHDRLKTELIPDVQPAVLDYITDTLYPPIFSYQKELGLFFSNQTSIGYNDSISSLATLQADWFLTSNAYALLKAFGVNRTYAYLFDEGLGLHGEDTPYTFYGIGLVHATVARAF
ncbi:MAG: hypothetical protein ALECFALPRED_000977 [Alectoria fallacina]|uniref:Carboxylesterase type B domain-containing protein n=1 Tax=Alectoria fallacina TaxID=1903189 RepID=A0A8H3FAK6_9LECA|nr:MAG: hypothetical protein ALECFALPRED_000977 [Alectoria fallacina]